jgi:hypothetical protein
LSEPLIGLIFHELYVSAAFKRASPFFDFADKNKSMFNPTSAVVNLQFSSIKYANRLLQPCLKNGVIGFDSAPHS